MSIKINFNIIFSQANVSAPLPPRPAMEVDEQQPPAHEPAPEPDTIPVKIIETNVLRDAFSGSDSVGRSLRDASEAVGESKMEVETKSPSPVDRKKIKIDKITNDDPKDKGVLHVVSYFTFCKCMFINYVYFVARRTQCTDFFNGCYAAC